MKVCWCTGMLIHISSLTIMNPRTASSRNLGYESVHNGMNRNDVKSKKCGCGNERAWDCY
jgi:hypothetical protein